MVIVVFIFITLLMFLMAVITDSDAPFYMAVALLTAIIVICMAAAVTYGMVK